MATLFSWAIIAEILLTVFIAWGLMHEERFIDFEDRLIAHFKAKIKRRKGKKNGNV